MCFGGLQQGSVQAKRRESCSCSVHKMRIRTSLVTWVFMIAKFSLCVEIKMHQLGHDWWQMTLLNFSDTEGVIAASYSWSSCVAIIMGPPYLTCALKCLGCTRPCHCFRSCPSLYPFLKTPHPVCCSVIGWSCCQFIYICIHTRWRHHLGYHWPVADFVGEWTIGLKVMWFDPASGYHGLACLEFTCIFIFAHF